MRFPLKEVRYPLSQGSELVPLLREDARPSGSPRPPPEVKLLHFLRFLGKAGNVGITWQLRVERIDLRLRGPLGSRSDMKVMAMYEQVYTYCVGHHHLG